MLASSRRDAFQFARQNKAKNATLKYEYNSITQTVVRFDCSVVRRESDVKRHSGFAADEVDRFDRL